MTYPSYPEYKNSGVAWLGRVPAHWEVMSIKCLSQVKRGASPRPIDDPKYFDDDGEYAWVRIADVTASDRYLNKTTQRLSELGQSLSVPLEPGDLFLSIAGSVGKPIISAIKCCIHDGFVYFPYWKQSKGFLYYIFLSGQPYLGLGKLGTQLNLNTDTVANIKIGLPPLPEQQAIARFLDIKTAQIDALIAKKQALLEKLAEKRTALISTAVTKGLTHLNAVGGPQDEGMESPSHPSAPMKDSGITWLGEIPAHWETKRLKFGVSLISNKVDAQESELDYMGLEHIESWTGKRIADEDAGSEGIATLFIPGDVLFGKLRPYLAKVHLAQHRGLVSTEALVIRPKAEVSPKYLKYYLVSKDFINEVNGSTFGSKMPRANWEFIGNQFLLFPPLPEQQAIARFLDVKTAELDGVRTEIEAAITKLQEYRSALITHAVTGKINVQDVVLPESVPEEIEDKEVA